MQISIFVIFLILPFCLSGTGKPRTYRDASEIELALDIVAVALRHYNFQLRSHSIETSILMDMLVVTSEVARSHSHKNRNVIPPKYRNLTENKPFNDWERKISKSLRKHSSPGGSGKISSRGNNTTDFGSGRDEGNNLCFGFCFSKKNIDDMLRCLPKRIKWKHSNKGKLSKEQGMPSNESNFMIIETRNAASFERLDYKIRSFYPAILGHIKFLLYGILHNYEFADWELEYMVANIKKFEKKMNKLIFDGMIESSADFQLALEFYAFATKNLADSIITYIDISYNIEASIDYEDGFEAKWSDS